MADVMYRFSFSVTIHYPCWHLGYVNIYAPYRAFSADHIDAVLGVKVGLRTVNITLAGMSGKSQQPTAFVLQVSTSPTAQRTRARPG